MPASQSNGRTDPTSMPKGVTYPDFSTTSPTPTSAFLRPQAKPTEPSPFEVRGEIDIERVYLAPEAGSLELRSALVLLREAIEWVDRALSDLQSGDTVHADDAMQHVHALLPELFCCRALGDGFAALVGALLEAFDNLRGSAMLPNQIRVVRVTLEMARSNPRLAFERASEQIDRLEKTGLDVEPPLGPVRK